MLSPNAPRISRHNKSWRFQPDAMEHFEEEDGFLARQLNETQYLSRTARTYLAYLYDERGEGLQVSALYQAG